MELLMHSGDEYVASFEPESLAALTYTKFADIPVAVTSACVPWRTPSGKYPVLKHEVNVIHEDVLDYLGTQGRNLDGALTAKQAAESCAYKMLVRDVLHKALLYCRWLDSDNFSNFTRKWYSNQLPFPLTIFLPHMKHRSIQSKLENECTPDLTPDMFHNLVLARARECINTLSVKLKDQPYFFGDKPTSLDAVVYGYLDNLIQYTFPGNNSLQKHIYCCDNLLQFCTKIRSHLYPDCKTGMNGEADEALSNWQPAVWISVGTAASLLLIQMYRVGWFYKPPIPDTKTSLENYL